MMKNVYCLIVIVLMVNEYTFLLIELFLPNGSLADIKANI